MGETIKQLAQLIGKIIVLMAIVWIDIKMIGDIAQQIMASFR